MKSKNILKEIRNSLRLIKAYNKKGESTSGEETSNLFKEHAKKHDFAVGLRNEIASLKTALKSKNKEMTNLMKELSKSSKTAKKALKKSKITRILEKIQVEDSPSAKVDAPKRSIKSNKPRIPKKKIVKAAE
jgi:molecular chaperone GrpE (heat shock protein)